MLVNSLLSKIRLNFMIGRAFSQVAKHPLVGSQFFQVGPRSNNSNKPISKLFNTTFNQIEKLQALFQQKSQTILKKFRQQQLTKELSRESQQKKQIKQYLQAYGSLMQAIQKSRIENVQTYNIIGWYNMLPLKKNLIEKLFNCKPEQLPPIIQSLSWMNGQQESIENYFYSKEDFLEKSKVFFRKIPLNLTVEQLKKIDEIIKPDFYYDKRKFYQVYLRINLENILRNVQLNENEQFADDIVWLLEIAIRAMNDSDLNISKIEKFILSWRPKLKEKSIEKLMKVYSDIGRVNIFIYQQYIKPFILKKKMLDATGMIQTVRFILCSQLDDKEILSSCLQKLNSENNKKELAESQLSQLHTFTHYMSIKGQKANLAKTLSKKMDQGCRQQNCISTLNTIILKNNNKTSISKMKKSKYISECLQERTEKKIKKIDEAEKQQFKEQFDYQLPGINFAQVDIYKKISFCNFKMEYLLYSKTKNELINVETDCQAYIFNSGQIRRDNTMREEMLEYYGIKVKYMNSQKYQLKERKLSEEQSMMTNKFYKKRRGE